MWAVRTYGASMNIHGYLEFTWVKSILYVKAYGPFNEEGAIKASNEYLNHISNRNDSKYSIIEIWDEHSLGSPKVMEKVASMWSLCFEYNCISIAIVVSNMVQEGVSKKLLPFQSKIFMKKEYAEIWTKGLVGI